MTEKSRGKFSIAGCTLAENAPSIEASPATTYVATDTVNRQYCDDTPAAAQCMLATEYDGDDGRPTGAAQLARLCVRLVAERGIARGRAFHIGCATGRTTFTLADAFDEVRCDACVISFISVRRRSFLLFAVYLFIFLNKEVN